MKRKAFGLLAIFLVIFQLFSPWMVNLSNNRPRIEKNIASAQDSKETINDNDVFFDGKIYYNNEDVKNLFYEKINSKYTELTKVTPYTDIDTKKVFFKVEFGFSFFNSELDNDADAFADTGFQAGVADDSDSFGWWDMLAESCSNVLNDELIMENGCDMSSYDEDNKLRDLRVIEDGVFDTDDFNGLILDISDDKKFPKEKTKSYNLNPSIFGGTTPETSLNSMIFQRKGSEYPGVVGGKKIYPINSEDAVGGSLTFEEGKEYFARLRIVLSSANLGFLGTDGAYVITSDTDHLAIREITFTYSNLIEQTVREENPSTVEEGGDISFLPKCGTDWKLIGNGGSLTGCFIHIFYWVFFVPSSYLLAAAGSVLDFVLAYSIKPDAYKAQYIVDGWRFVRDVCNLFFIFMLIYLAFKMILGASSSAKQSIVNTLIVATVINFSYPLTTIIIDASNITARQLYYNAFNKQDEDGKPLSLSGAAAKGYNPQKIIIEGMEKNPTFDKEENPGTIFMILLVGVIFNVIAIFMFIKLALQFIYRIIGLIFAIILSPLAIFSYSLSDSQRSKLKFVEFDEWLNGLLTDAFKAPVFLFLMMILILFVNNNPFEAVFGPDVNGLEWWVSLIVPFMLIVAFFKVITSITKGMTSQLAQLAGGAVMQMVGAVSGVAAGGIGLAGAGIIGKGMGKLAESKMGQRIMDRSVNNKGLSGFIAKQQVKAMRGMQGGSYDIRQTGVMNAVSKESGADFNLGTKFVDKGLGAVGLGAYGLSTGMRAGGYMAQGDRVNKEREEYLKLVQHDKILENKLKDKKDVIEDTKDDIKEEIENIKEPIEEEKKNREAELRDQKALQQEKTSQLKDAEKYKTDADEALKAIESLEDLIAKRLDIIAKTPPGTTPSTNEIDNQIARLEQKVTSNTSDTAKTAATDPRTGVIDRGILITEAKQEAERNKSRSKTLVNGRKDQLKEASDGVKTTEDNIRELDRRLRTETEPLQTRLKELDADLGEINKAIENVRNNRSNVLAHKVRNKSGRIYRRKTYRENLDGSARAYSTKQDRAFSTASGGDDLRDEMSSIVTGQEERSNQRRSYPVRGWRHVTVNGQTNETYRSSRDADNYRPDTQDAYTPPNNS